MLRTYEAPKAEKNFLILLFLLIFLAPSRAEAADPKECVVLTDGASRLKCYDEAVRGSANVALLPTKSIGKWKVKTQKSKLDDSANISLQLPSVDLLRDRFGSVKYLSLHLRCAEGATVLYFHFGGLFMSNIESGGRISYRFDTEKANSALMSASNDHEALGLWDSNGAIAFAKKISKAKSLYIRATPHSESTVSGSFELDGIEEALVTLRKACRW
jgi:type VI secretion system protein VasI